MHRARTFAGLWLALASLCTVPAFATPFAAMSRDGSNIDIFDVAINARVATITGLSSAVAGHAIAANGRLYISEPFASRIRVIDLATYADLGTIATPTQPNGLEANPSGTRLYAATFQGNDVHVIDTASGTVLATVTAGAFTSLPAVTPSGAEVYVSNSSGGSVSVIDAATHTVVATIPVGTTPYGVAFLPDGSLAFVGNYFTSTISVIDTATRTVVATWPSCDGSSNLDVSNDGTRLYVSCANGPPGMVAHDMTGTMVANAAIPVGRGWVVQVEPGGTRVFAAGQNALHVRDANLGAIQSAGTAAGFSTVGRRFISTMADDTTPSAFVFPAQTPVTVSTVITSAPALITGINTRTTISVTGGEYCVSSANACSCDVSAFGAAAGTILPNQYACVRHTSAAAGLALTTTTLSVGGVNAAFTSTTGVLTTFAGPAATGAGTLTATLTGGGAACTFSAPQFIGSPPGAPPVPPTLPAPDIFFPYGMFDFSATGCTPGSTLTFTLTFPQAISTGARYWKYGPTASDPAPHWYVLPAAIAGNTVTFTIADGGLGDDDLAANGTIVDQGGLGFPASAHNVPSVSQWALGLLALLLLATGLRTSRTRGA